MTMEPESLAFPTLSDEQMTCLSEYGRELTVAEGDALFRQGDARSDFYIILDGEIDIVDEASTPEMHLATHGRGRFTGELNMLTGQAALATARVRTDGRVLAIEATCLRVIMATHVELGDMVLAAFVERRAMLMKEGLADLRIFGSRYSPATHQLREFAERSRLPHKWIDLDSDPEADAMLAQFGLNASDTPVVICHGRQVLKNPTVETLAQCLGLHARSVAPGQRVDLIVIGAGPAGLAAAVYAASEGLSTLTLDVGGVGGQAGSSSKIENYLGFPTGISGADLAERAMVQAMKFGARIALSSEVIALRPDGHGYRVDLVGGTTAEARSVIIATGARYRKLPLSRLGQFECNGIYYTAGEMEARLCGPEEVVIIGSGNSAGQAAVFLSARARHVYLVVRGDDLAHSMSRYLIDRIREADTIDVLVRTQARELLGDAHLEGVVLDTDGEASRTIHTKFVFSFIGAEACTRWLDGTVALDRSGFIMTGAAAEQAAPASFARRNSRPTGLLETSLPGVFAVGDVRSGSVKRVASAVGEGSMAVKFVHEFLAVS